MYNHNKAQQSKNRVHISLDILYLYNNSWPQSIVTCFVPPDKSRHNNYLCHHIWKFDYLLGFAWRQSSSLPCVCVWVCLWFRHPLTQKYHRWQVLKNPRLGFPFTNRDYNYNTWVWIVAQLRHHEVRGGGKFANPKSEWIFVPTAAVGVLAWWHHQMETFSALLALCTGNSSVTGGFPAQMPVTRSFDVSLICACMNSWVNTREAGDFRPLWRHSNGFGGPNQL